MALRGNNLGEVEDSLGWILTVRLVAQIELIFF